MTLLAVPEHFIMLDLTVHMDIHPQPGPELTSEDSGKRDKEKLSKPLGSKQFGQNHRTRNPSFPSEVCLQTMCFCHRRSQGTGYLKIQRPTRRKELRLSIMRLLKDILRASKLWRVVVPLKPINNDLNTGT